ncbi:MAG: hypothetical protein K0U38_11085 [Epsilonproteobacteria bacterium]|nr:hypothetical protein [Campylobacterota bacterium]
MKKILRNITYVSLSAVLLSSTVMADEVTDTMKEAMEAYEKGDYVQVKDDLTYVLELLKQKKGDSLKTLLPAALDGWKAEDATSETAGSGMLGGGTNISRIYKKDKSKITISVVTDSPLMQSIGMMISNPMFSSGGKLKRINREKAMIKYNEKQKSGEISLVLDKRYMITVKGREVTEEELVEYTKAIDFKKLKAQ